MEEAEGAKGPTPQAPSCRTTDPSSTKFESYLPTGCPPMSAVHGPKLVYRLIRSPAPGPENFRTVHEEGKYLSADACRRCSMSVSANIDGVRKLRRKVRYFKDHLICRGVIPSDAGVLEHTPSREDPEHCSWWPAQGVSRHHYFSVVT